MLETLEGLEAGAIQPIPQDNAGASLAPILDARRCSGGLHPIGGRDLQPLAWLSTLARSLYILPRQKADSASPATGRIPSLPRAGNW